MRLPGVATDTEANGSDALALFGTAFGENGTASNPGNISQFGSDDFDAFESPWHGMFFGGFADDGHHFIRQRFHYTTTQNHDFGAEDVHEVGHAYADIFGGFVNYFGDKLVPTANGFS